MTKSNPVNRVSTDSCGSLQLLWHNQRFSAVCFNNAPLVMPMSLVKYLDRFEDAPRYFLGASIFFQKLDSRLPFEMCGYSYIVAFCFKLLQHLIWDMSSVVLCLHDAICFQYSGKTNLKGLNRIPILTEKLIYKQMNYMCQVCNLGFDLSICECFHL